MSDLAPRRSSSALGNGALWKGAVWGSLATLVVTAAVLVFVFRARTPLLTEAALQAARQRWSRHGPDSYELDLEIHGRQPGRVHLEVANGRVIKMTRDGVTPRRKITWEAWTVPGQFDTIELELSKAADPARGFGAPAGSQLVQRAEFDPRWGYPRLYQRMIMGTALEIDWTVTRFVRK